MASLSDRAGFLIVANLIKYAVGFVMPMVLVRMLSQNDYGSYQQMILISTAATGVMSLGLPTSIYFFYHNIPKDRVPALVGQTMGLLTLSGFLVSFTILLWAPELSASVNNPDMAGLLRLYAISAAFMIGSEHCAHFMIAQDRYALAVLFEIIETFCRVLTLLAPLWFGYGFGGLIAGVIFYSILRYVIRNGYLFSSSELTFSGWKNHTFVREQLGYSIPIALVTLTSLIGITFNRGILAASFSPAHYAIYSVGALEIPLNVIFQASVANVLRASLPPLVREGNLAEVTRIIREAVRKLSIIVLPSFIFLFGHAQEFITLLFTSRYAESVNVFRIYVWLVPLHMLVLSPIPQIFGKTRLNMYIVVAMTAVLLALSWWMLQWIGFYGPALAQVIAQYLQVVVFFFVVVKLTRAPIHHLLPIRHIANVVLSSLAGLVVSQIAHGLCGSALLDLILSGIIFSATFFATALPLRVLSAEDQRLILRWLAKLKANRVS